MFVRTKDYNMAVTYVSHALSKDKNRPIFMCYHIFTNQNNELVIEAVDGFCANRTRIPVLENCVPLNMIVDGLEKIKTKDEGIEIKVESDHVVIGNKIYRSVEGTFLDLDNVFPKEEPTFKIAFNPAVLLQALKDIPNNYIIENDKGWNHIILEFNTEKVNVPVVIKAVGGVNSKVYSKSMALPVSTKYGTIDYHD